MPKSRVYPSITFIGNRFYSFQYYLHKGLRMPLWKLIGFMIVIFFIINGSFAILYKLTSGLELSATGNVTEPSFWDILFFCYTFPVVGYGGIIPIGIGKLVAVIQIFIGLLILASMTGVMFTKFSQTPSPFLWSKFIVINEQNGKRYLQVRVNNVVGNDVINVIPELYIQRVEKVENGNVERNLIPLKLRQAKIPIFAFSWILTHEIDIESPVYAWTTENANASDRIIGFICGHDSILGKEVYSYARWAYSESLKGMFDDVLVEYKEDSDLRPNVVLDFSKIDSVNQI